MEASSSSFASRRPPSVASRRRRYAPGAGGPEAIYSMILWLGSHLAVQAIANQQLHHQSDGGIGFETHYDEADAIIITQPIGRSHPKTAIDLTAKAFLYVTENDCYFGHFRSPGKPSDLRRPPGIKKEQIMQTIMGGMQKLFARHQVHKNELSERLRSGVLNECQSDRVWVMHATEPPKLEPTLRDYLENYERNRTKTHAGSRSAAGIKGTRVRRGVTGYFSVTQRRVRRPHFNPRKTKTRRSKQRPGSKPDTQFQADDTLTLSAPGGGRGRGREDLYTSSFSASGRRQKPSFQHYKDFNSELNAIPPSYAAVEENASEARPGSPTSRGANMDIQFPDTIVKDGQVFYRHDGSQTDEGETYHSPKSKSDSYPSAHHVSHTQNHAMGTDESLASMGFDFLTDHVQKMGSQRPLISAAIAGASIRGSSKGSTSHVIGSAINGGYFAASAQGYDGKGGAIHSHVQGTAKGVSGGASAIAPDKDGEVFIQVDNSERGLSIGQSSTHNGEAFVIADIDSDEDNNVQHGDSVSSYTDIYKTKKYGHSFGEAKSSISSPRNFAETPTSQGGQKHQSEMNDELRSYSLGKHALAMGMLDNIKEKVHQPGITHSALTSKAEGAGGKDGQESSYAKGVNYKIDESGLLVGSGSAPREGEIQQVSLGVLPEGGIRPKKKDKEGVVGLVTYPYGQLGSPPGPGELLTQSPEIFVRDEANSNGGFEREYFFDPSLILPSEDDDDDYDYKSDFIGRGEVISHRNLNSDRNIEFLESSHVTPPDDQTGEKIESSFHHSPTNPYHINYKPESSYPFVGDKFDGSTQLSLNNVSFAHSDKAHVYDGYPAEARDSDSRYSFSSVSNRKPEGGYPNPLFQPQNASRATSGDASYEFISGENYPYPPETPPLDSHFEMKNIDDFGLLSSSDGQPPTRANGAHISDEVHRATNYVPRFNDYYLSDTNNVSNFHFSHGFDNEQDYNVSFNPGIFNYLYTTPSYSEELPGAGLNFQPGDDQELFPEEFITQPSRDSSLIEDYNGGNSHASNDLATPLPIDDHFYFGTSDRSLHSPDTTTEVVISPPPYQPALLDYSPVDSSDGWRYQGADNLQNDTNRADIPVRDFGDDANNEEFELSEFHHLTFNVDEGTLNHTDSHIDESSKATPRTLVLPINRNIEENKFEDTKILKPGEVGSTREIQPSGPDQPQIKVVTMDKSDRRRLIYQKEGTPIGPGQKIPGIPGYRVPPGFRGRVVYGHNLPVEVESKKAVQGYNTRVTVKPQRPHRGPLFTSISGPTANSSGVQITLSSFDRNGNNNRRGNAPSSSFSRRVSNGSRNQANQQLPHSSRGRNSNYRNHYPDSRSHSSQRNSNDQCGYYENECRNTYGPYTSGQLCIPKLIVVPCCC